MSTASNDLSPFQKKTDKIKSFYAFEVQSSIHRLMGLCELSLSQDLTDEDKILIRNLIEKEKEKSEQLKLEIFDKLDNLLK